MSFKELLKQMLPALLLQDKMNPSRKNLGSNPVILYKGNMIIALTGKIKEWQANGWKTKGQIERLNSKRERRLQKQLN